MESGRSVDVAVPPLAGQPSLHRHKVEGGGIADKDHSAANRINAMHGKVVIVDFWGTWCGPCRIQISELKQLYSKHHDKGLEIIGVHTEDGANELDAFVKEKNIPWLNLVDKGDTVAKAFQVPHYPSLFIVDREGVLRIALAHPIGLEEAVLSLLAK
jgi:thiol-disulfide isomerase/thioredoxin